MIEERKSNKAACSFLNGSFPCMTFDPSQSKHCTCSNIWRNFAGAWYHFMPHSDFFTISAALLGKMFACLKVKRHEDNQTFFTKNGAALLEELIAFCNGRSNPIRHFSTNELLTATNYYDANQMFLQSGFYKLYKGSLNYRPIFVKKYHNCRIWRDVAAKDIAVGSQMSVHKNVLKVLGCCLETETPIIVYEFAGTESLSTCISATNVEPLPWKCRLKIAVGIANAVAYLHTAFSRPVIHRSIHCSSIVLDQNNVPKLIDFGLCISIPEGQSHVKDAIRGRAEWVSPEYWDRGITISAEVA
ncbi:Serine-threonine/tyrosine-protein kinase [Theobroma cacao]|nr:Serine-threonine/tyrosine-protein kinase [Theobroma cacao]